MRRIKRYIWQCLSLMAIFMMTSCIEENMGDCPDDVSSPTENWITLQFYVSEGPSVTRANPVGGEDGNGREDEIFNEAKIHDVNLFLFADNSNQLLNAASNTTLTHLYFNLDDPGDPQNTLSFEKEVPDENSTTIVYTVKFLDEVPGIVLPLRTQGTVRFITVANRGRSMKGEVSDLEDLWDYNSLSTTWTGEGQDISEGYDRFVMTTAYDTPSTDSYISFSTTLGAGTESDPFTGKTTLQRMCARIDVMYTDENLKTKDDCSELKYQVDDTGNTVHILNMLPVNVMSKPSYLFKKVTNGLPNDWTNVNGHTWGGKETTDENGKPSNYVLEPNTLEKEIYNSDNLPAWYGSTRTSDVKTAIKSAQNGTVGGYHHGLLISSDEVSNSYSKIAVLGYANENTQSPNQFNSNYLTGIAFRAVYVPATIQPTVLESPEPSTKIYRYSPSKDGTVDESKSLYFPDRASCDAYQELHKEDMAIVTEFEAITYDGKPAFECYYNLWLRHYDDIDDENHSDPHEKFPMQYATVRNNIYRVGLKFTGPGDPTPTMREPETMQARILVRKWNQRFETKPLEF